MDEQPKNLNAEGQAVLNGGTFDDQPLVIFNGGLFNQAYRVPVIDTDGGAF